MTFFGKLSLTAIPTEPIQVFAMLFIVAVVIGAAVVLTVVGKWRYVWRECTDRRIMVDHGAFTGQHDAMTDARSLMERIARMGAS